MAYCTQEQIASGNYADDDYGNCVYQPVDYTQDPTFTGWGGGDWDDPGEFSDLGSIKAFLLKQDPSIEFADYQSWFDPYVGSEWEAKEKLLRSGMGIDIGQLYSTWEEFTAPQLYTDWYGEDGGYIGERQRLLNLKGEAGTMWGLMADPWDPVTGLGGDIGRREWEAGVGWDIQKGGLEETWLYNKEKIGRGTRGALGQTMQAQDVALSSIGFATAGTSAFDRMQREIREGYIREVEEGERGLTYGLAMGEHAYDQVIGRLKGERILGEEAYNQEIARLQHMIDTGELTYDQAVEAGEWTLGMSATDLNQALEQQIWQVQQDWRDQQRRNLHALMAASPTGVDCDEPENADHPSCTGDGETWGCTDSDASNYNSEATQDDGNCIYDGDGFITCEDNGLVTCDNGDCVSSIADCITTADDEFWIEDGKTCWEDSTGATQCFGDLDWDLTGFDIDLDFNWGLDQSSCADKGGTWNDDTGKCEGVAWFDFSGIDLDEGMNNMCKGNDPNSHWDGTKCVAGAGDYEATDYNQELTTDQCSQMGGVGFSGNNINACVTEDSIGDFSNCIDGEGTIEDCASLLLAVGTTNPFIVVGATIAEQLGILDWVADMFDFDTSGLAYGQGCTQIQLSEGCTTDQERVWSGTGIRSTLYNVCNCPTGQETGGTGGFLPGGFCFNYTCPNGTCADSEDDCDNYDYPKPFN